MNELIGKIVVIKRNGADGPQFPLRTTECFFGRKPACDIRIQLPNVSLEHAVVKVDEKDKIRIINLSSTNQTLVNGKPITEAEVKHLDVFTISDRSFRFEFASPVLKKGKDKSPKTKIRRSVSLVKTPPEGQSPKMPVALKGSPRTPTAGESLKENIHRLRRFSMPLQEEDENLSSPVSNKPPLSTIFINAEPQDKSNHQESTEQVNVVKPVEVVKETRRNSKRVSFGPVLSPEQFDKDLPPATPVRRGSTPKRAASSAKRRRSVLSVPKTDCIKEDDGGVEDFFMTEDVDSNAKSLEEHHISPEEDSHELESVGKESTAVQEKVPGSVRDTPERSQPSSEQITPKSTKPKSRRRSSSLVGKMKLELTETSRVTTASDTVTEESKNARRSSLRLAQKSPVQRSIAPETAATASNDDEDIDETILDSDDYTSDEEDPVGGEGKETGQSKLGKALKEEVEQQKAKKIATPMKNEIANGVNLRQTKKKMTTPLRKEIEEGVKLHETKKRMATPLKKDIENGTNLRQTKKKMATPLKKEIKEGITLQQTKKRMATPLKKEIETGTSLRENKKKLATPLKKEIENGTNLRETKKRLATPLKKEIENGTNLRQTKKMMGTPLKKEIETGTTLRETKKKLATPLKKEIENGTSLRQTKKMMGTPLKKEIKEGIKLHQTKKTMATPLKKEIKNGTSLRQTKKKMATPLRTEILEGVKLRETKKKLQTPVRKAIEDGVTLKKTKSKLSTPLRKAIQAKPELRQTKKIMNVLLQDDIKQGVNLRKTKQSMPLEVQIEIIKGKKLRSTKKSLPTPVKNDISGGVTLRKTKKSLPTPLKEQIKKGLPLQKTKKSLPTPVRKQLEGKVTLKSTVKSVKRKRSEGGLNEHDAKRMKTSPSEEVNEESKGFQEAPVRRALKTPLRKAIIAGRKLRPTRHRMATPLRTGIHSRPALRAVRRKSSSVRDEIGPRKPTYAEIVKRATKTALRRSSKGNSFKFGKTAPICKKAESVPPAHVANVADVVAADHEVPSKPVNDSQSIQKRRSARLDGKAVPQAMVDSVGVLNSPETNENAPQSTWMSSLARATNGVKARAKPVEDLEGLVEMFATPPMVDISKDTSKQQKGSNWLSSLAKATKAPRKRGMAVEDFEGVPEMFATPPSISVATPRTTTEDELTSSPEEQDLNLTESLKLSKTPSLRSFGEDTEFVQIKTPIHSSHTPSLRSRNAQTIKSAVTPEVLLEMKEALMTQKTPSLRSSAKDAVTVEVVTPLQPSRTPSLRSAMQQTSVFSSESPDIKMEVIKPIAPTKTPSIRSSAQVKAVSAVNVKKTSTSDRKSLGLQGLARLMKVPKENNAVENVEDFFAPSVFASPKPEPKRYSRKSEGLQGVARLLRTPGDMGEGAAVESPKFDGIKKMMRTEKAVASPNFVGLRALMQTPKDSKRAVDLEEHFISDLFLLPVEDSFQDTVQSVVQGECDKEQDVQAINLISPESEEKTGEASEDVSSETVQRVTRAKRKPPKKLPEPVPKRGRSTRAAAKQSSEGKTTPSNPKVVQRKTTTRSKKSSATSLPSTPKPLEFKRTQLDPIIEVLSPLPVIDQTVEVAASPTLVEPEATEKAFTRGGVEETTEFKAQQTESSRCSRRGIRAKARVDSSSKECSGGEVTEKRVATKRRTRAKVEEDGGSSSVDVQKADIETGKSSGKGRATRSSQLKEAPSQNVTLPRTTRGGRNRRAEAAEVEDKVVIGDAADETINNSTTTRSRRKARTTEESASVVSEEESVRNGKVQQNDAEATKVRRTRSRRTADKNNTVNEDKLAQSSQAKRTKKESVSKADEETQSEEKEASSKQRSTRRTRGNPVESIVPESTAASLQEVENFQSKSSVKNVRGKREPKGKALEEPRTTRSSRSANPAKIKPTVEPQLPVRSTRGRKRQLGEEEVAEPAVPEAKRKRSSARARDVEPPQTRSLRSRK